MAELEHQIAASLRRDAAELIDRWRARVVAIQGATGARQDRETDHEPGAGPALVEGLATALVGDARGMVGLARAGWHLGSSRHRDGADLFQVLRELQLLEAVVLYAAERAAETLEGVAAQGLHVARGIQRGTGLLSRAATKGFTHAWLGEQRRRASTLRHDIRNPLGTIRNAVAFLEDETIPSHLRDLERFQRMIVRNAAQADALVSRYLGDGAVVDAALPGQDVSIHDVALAVRRSLREEAREAGVEIIVADALPMVSVDATAVELALLATVAGALEGRVCRQVSIEPDATRERSVRIRIGVEPGERRDGEGLNLARELAQWAGGELTLDDTIVLELPLSPRESRGDVAGADER